MTTPYGYGGPPAPATATPSTRPTRPGAASGVVTTFVRFHPLLGNVALARGVYRERLANRRVAARPGGDLIDGMHQMHRRGVRKAVREGVEASFERGPAPPGRLRGALRRDDAPPRRRRVLLLLARLLGVAGGAARRARPRSTHAATGSSSRAQLYLASPPWLHYHLGAATDEGFRLGAAKLLFYEAAGWARRTASRSSIWGAGSAGARTRSGSSSSASRPTRATSSGSASSSTTRRPTARSGATRTGSTASSRPTAPAGRDVLTRTKGVFWGAPPRLAWTHAGYPLAAAVLARTRPRPCAATNDAVRDVDRPRPRRGRRDRGPRREPARARLPGRAARDRGRLRRLRGRDRRDRRGDRRPRAARPARSLPARRQARDDQPRPCASGSASSSRSPTRTPPGSRTRCASSCATSPTRTSATSPAGSRSATPTARTGRALYWRYELWLRESESALGSITGGNGAIYAVRRRDFEAPLRPGLGPSGSHGQGAPRGLRPGRRRLREAARDLEDEFGRKVRMFRWSWFHLLEGKHPRAASRRSTGSSSFSHRTLRYGERAPARRPARASSCSHSRAPTRTRPRRAARLVRPRGGGPPARARPRREPCVLLPARHVGDRGRPRPLRARRRSPRLGEGRGHPLGRRQATQ